MSTRDEIRRGFSKNLMGAMEQQRIGPSELSVRTGISKRTLQRYLKGETIPDLDQLEALADCVGTSRYSLLVY